MGIRRTKTIASMDVVNIELAGVKTGLRQVEVDHAGTAFFKSTGVSQRV